MAPLLASTLASLLASMLVSLSLLLKALVWQVSWVLLSRQAPTRVTLVVQAVQAIPRQVVLAVQVGQVGQVGQPILLRQGLEVLVHLVIQAVLALLAGQFRQASLVVRQILTGQLSHPGLEGLVVQVDLAGRQAWVQEAWVLAKSVTVEWVLATSVELA